MKCGSISRSLKKTETIACPKIPIGQPRFSVYYDSVTSEEACKAGKVIYINDVTIATRKLPNCRLKVDTHKKKVYLVVFSFIPKDTEILTYKMNN